MPNQDMLAIIIPTKDRPESLARLLQSIAIQSTKPAQVIVVDAGAVLAEQVIKEFPQLPIDYIQTSASLTHQRNVGLKMLKKEIRFVAFFDDDVELYAQTTGVAMKFLLKSGSEVAAIACNGINYIRAKTFFLEKLFLISNDGVGVLLPSGFQSRIWPVDNDYQVQWVMGGATFWRRSIFNSYQFDEWFHGYAHCEDIDFSYRVSQKYKFFILKDAKIVHKTASIEKKSEYSLGKMQVINRLYFVKKSSSLSVPLCYWACSGLFLKNIILGTVSLNCRYLLRGFGVLVGLAESFFRLKKVKENVEKVKTQ